MRISKKILAVFLCSMLAFHTPVISANAAAPDNNTSDAANTRSAAATGSEYLQLNHSQYTMTVGHSLALSITQSPEPAANAVWSSSAADIASVNNKGVVTAHKKGIAVITAQINFGAATYTASCRITVNNAMAFSKASYTLNAGKTQQLSLVTIPANANASVTYTSSNPSVATVSPGGLVTARSGGSSGSSKAVITASWDNIKASCTILVKNTISLNKKSFTLYAGTKKSYTLKAAGNPKGKVTWKSSNPKIATVNSKGQVTPKKAGKVTITASCNGVSASCRVTVKKSSISLTSKKTVYLKHPVTLKAKAVPSGKIKWKSSNTKIATVNSKGKVTPKKTGTVTITASCNGVSDSCRVTVKKPSISLTSKKTVYLKNPVTLKATAAPSGKIKWKSSNTKIATVNSKGKVTPKKTGTVTISASCNGITKKCKVSVKKPSISSYTSSITVLAENGQQLSASTKVPATIKWKSSNRSVASVDKKGYVTGKKPGTAVITAYVPGAQTKITVTVLKNNYTLNSVKNRLVTGESTYLYMNNVPNSAWVSFTTDNYSVVGLSTSNNRCKVTAYSAGTAKVTASFSAYIDGNYISCSRTCTIVVSENGIRQQQLSLPVKTSKKLTLKNVEKPGVSIRKTSWSSSKPSVVKVDSRGVITAKKSGSATIKARVTYSNGTGRTFSTYVKVSNPKLKSSYQIIAAGQSVPLKVSGTNSYSNITWKSKKSSLVSVGANGLATAAYGKTGSTTVTIKTDGKTLKQKIIVTNPELKADYGVIAPTGKVKISLKNVHSKSKISYKSDNSSVASVSKSGTVTAKRYGQANITITADGKKLTFIVDVAPQAAINACINGYSIINSSTYSQALRMTPGYYDCSSLVFRAYGSNAGLLGGSPSWAPTAANMAVHMENTGKVLAYGPVDISSLRPGDLIFYSGGPNGRYRNIYHVSMYYGGGYRLEKPLRFYYPASNVVMVARPVS